MLNLVIYRFFENDEKAIATFDLNFEKQNRIEEFRGGVSATCFGSYGTQWNLIPAENKENFDYYFAIGAKTDQVEKAIEYFNSVFENIKFRIVKKYMMYEVDRGSWYGTLDYSENGYKELGLKTGRPYYMYVFNIVFSPEYSQQTKYDLRIPLGFFIRMYTGYYSSLDHEDLEEIFKDLDVEVDLNDYIQMALEFSNAHPDLNSGLISNYIVPREVFDQFDNVNLMNKYFSNPLTGVRYNGSTSNLQFGGSIRPYCVYFVIDHNGKIK